MKRRFQTGGFLGSTPNMYLNNLGSPTPTTDPTVPDFSPDPDPVVQSYINRGYDKRMARVMARQGPYSGNSPSLNVDTSQAPQTTTAPSASAPMPIAPEMTKPSLRGARPPVKPKGPGTDDEDTSKRKVPDWYRYAAAAQLPGNQGIGTLLGGTLGIALPLLFRKKQQPEETETQAQGGPIGGYMDQGPLRFQDGGQLTPDQQSWSPVGKTQQQQQDMANQAAAARPGGPTAAQNLGMMGLGINPFTGASAGSGLTPGAPGQGLVQAPGFGAAGAPAAPGSLGALAGAMPQGGPGGNSIQGLTGGGGGANAALANAQGPNPAALAAQLGRMQQGAGPGALGAGPGAGMPPSARLGLSGMPRPMRGMRPGAMGGAPPNLGGAPGAPGGMGAPPPAAPGGASLGAMPPGGGVPNFLQALQASAAAAQPPQGMPQGLPPGLAGIGAGGAPPNPAALGPMAPLPFSGPAPAGGMAKGGKVKDRQWSEDAKSADDIPPMPMKKARGGAITKKPKGTTIAIAIGHNKKKSPPISTPSPYSYEDDEGTAPPTSNATPPPMAKGGKVAKKAKGGKVTIKKSKGGKCKDTDKDGMAAGGAAKQRKGFPNTQPPPKRLAAGGKVRGCGAATKGCNFSGVY